MTVLILVLTIGGFSAAKPEFASRRLFEESKPYLKPEMKFAAVEYTEPSLVWEFRRILTNDMQTLDANQAADFLRENHPSVLIVPTSFYKTNIMIFGTNTISVQADGFNTAKGANVNLTAVINP